ncbi:MAG TPA: hypothetical protein VGW34_01245, partial [Allosphingosinicella sp.]|nr:hypothetical protein [Allosphingosinicella sp.]
MDEAIAKILVRSLLGRLTRSDGGYSLPGGVISPDEQEALSVLADLPAAKSSASPSIAAPALVSSRTRLNLDCLDKAPEEGRYVCLDFGTAFSKAAVWDHDEEDPLPLDLSETATGVAGYTAESCAYVTEGKILFGANASARHRSDNDDDRELFDSPKQYLTHSFEDLESPLKASLDPTRTFRKRELLTLYLGYLSAITSDQLERNGIDRYTKRRFAVPGWGDAQIDTTGGHSGPAVRLGSLFLEAQILADNISMDEWRAGLPVERARETLNQVAAIAPERRAASRFITEPVLEAVAASAGIQERFRNGRPQLLVVDVGAGTTDIGVFKITTPERGPALAFPYKSGMAAMPKAGNVVDTILITEICRKLGLSARSQLEDLYQHKLRRQIRELKIELFDRGMIVVDLEDFDTVEISRDEFVSSSRVQSFAQGFRRKITETLNRAGIGSENFVETRDSNLVVFTGGGSKLP